MKSCETLQKVESCNFEEFVEGISDPFKSLPPPPFIQHLFLSNDFYDIKDRYCSTFKKEQNKAILIGLCI